MKSVRVLAVTTLLLLAAAMPAMATIITFEYNIEFSGATPPGGSTPWLTATFNDGDGTGSVTLTLSTSGLIDSEFVSLWYFNFSGDATALASLIFTPVNNSDSVPVITTGLNAFQADGDGLYDIEFDFPPPPGNFDTKFTAGETVSYTITGAGITANSFNLLSFPAGGHGPFLSAAHVQGIGPSGEDSGWVAPGNGTPPPRVPEPATLLLLGSGLLGMGFISRSFHSRG